jgi:hypothetical protein
MRKRVLSPNMFAARRNQPTWQMAIPMLMTQIRRNEFDGAIFKLELECREMKALR